MSIGRVLVISPEPDLRRALVAMLEAQGYEVAEFEAVPPLSWKPARRFTATVLDQAALTGQPYDSIAFCIRAFPVVLLAAEAWSWLTEWTSAVVALPLTDAALAAAVVRAAAPVAAAPHA